VINGDDEQVQSSDAEIELTNEFATVRVRRIFTRNGVRLEITSPRLGRTVRLDPLSLESLTWQPSETFSRFLRHPYGPPPDDKTPC
jgi:hypothetical protein